MTILNGIEVDVKVIMRNHAVDAVVNNDPLDSILHVVVVNSNPCNYGRRIKLAREFLLRLSEAQNVKVYVVELAYDTQPFYITSAKNACHLQLRTTTALWHKENMINLGVERLLPSNWRAMAWIDADIEFENPRWALDALKVLNGSADVVQLWSHACDMDPTGRSMKMFESFASQHVRAQPFRGGVWHPGFAWAMTRKAWEKVGGLFDLSILGSGDMNMAMALRGQGTQSLNDDTTEAYKAALSSWAQRATGMRLSYVPGVVRHHFHGNKINRGYNDRWKILVEHAYDPLEHVAHGHDGLLVPTLACPPGLLRDIMAYFVARKEDGEYETTPHPHGRAA